MKKKCLGCKFLAVFLAVLVMLSSVGTAPVQTHAMEAARDDGTWLWPLPSNTLNSVVDWAGCIGSSYVCQFGCGVVHPCAAASHSRALGHAGLDMGVVVGTPVYASAAGTVVFYSYNDARGNTMVVEHKYTEDLSYYSYYEHLNSNAVSVGATVNAGDIIAYSGQSGVGYEPHLHFSIVFGPKDSVRSFGNLDAFESCGWLLNNSTATGRILVNPAATNEVTIGDLASGNLSLHKGSIHYTCDPTHVNIGMNGTVISMDSPWYYSGTPASALTYGMVSNEVKWLQQALNVVMDAGLGIDGSFGPSTKDAVVTYQSYFGLEADGSFGPTSLNNMLEQLLILGYMSDGSVHSHSFTEYVSNGDGTHMSKCAVCEYLDTKNSKTKCSGNATSGTEFRICEFCGATYEASEYVGDYGEGYTIAASEFEKFTDDVILTIDYRTVADEAYEYYQFSVTNKLSEWSHFTEEDFTFLEYEINEWNMITVSATDSEVVVVLSKDAVAEIADGEGICLQVYGMIIDSVTLSESSSTRAELTLDASYPAADENNNVLSEVIPAATLVQFEGPVAVTLDYVATGNDENPWFNTITTAWTGLTPSGNTSVKSGEGTITFVLEEEDITTAVAEGGVRFQLNEMYFTRAILTVPTAEDYYVGDWNTAYTFKASELAELTGDVTFTMEYTTVSEGYDWYNIQLTDLSNWTHLSADDFVDGSSVNEYDCIEVNKDKTVNTITIKAETMQALIANGGDLAVRVYGVMVQEASLKGEKPASQILNISNLPTGDITEATSYEGFTLTASSEKTMIIDSNSKTGDNGLSFTQRLKLGGAGSVTTRNISFTTSGAATVTVYAMSTSSSEDRTLIFATADGAEISKGTVTGASADGVLQAITYEASEAGTYYLWSEARSIAIYYIDVTEKQATEEPEEDDTNITGNIIVDDTSNPNGLVYVKIPDGVPEDGQVHLLTYEIYDETGALVGTLEHRAGQGTRTRIWVTVNGETSEVYLGFDTHLYPYIALLGHWNQYFPEEDNAVYNQYTYKVVKQEVLTEKITNVQTIAWDDSKAPGWIVWEPVEEAGGYYVSLYRDGSSVGGWQTQPEENTINMIDSINASGTYTVTISTYGGKTTLDSDKSGHLAEYVYTRPETEIATPTKIWWTAEEGSNVPTIAHWNPVVGAKGYVTNIEAYDAENPDGPRLDYIGFTVHNTETELVTYRDFSWQINVLNNRAAQEGKTYTYRVTVQALSGNVELLANSLTADFMSSREYKVQEKIEEEIKEELMLELAAGNAISSVVDTWGKDEFGDAMKSDSELREIMEDAESCCGVEIAAPVVEETLGIAVDSVEVIGAGMNAESGTVGLVVKKAKDTISLNKELYHNVTQMEITLEHEDASGSTTISELDVPMVITMPAPKDIEPERLVILHEHEGVVEPIYPEYNAADDTITFPVTGFSTFAFAGITLYDENGKEFIENNDSGSDGESGGGEATLLNGLVQGKDGLWAYYINGIVDTFFTGLVQNEAGWWYVENGYLNWEYTGLASNDAGTWYVKNGAIDFTYTDLFSWLDGWYYVMAGRVPTEYTGLVRNSEGLWYVEAGMINWNYTNLVSSADGWYYVMNGRVTEEYTGLVRNDAGLWYVAGGKLDESHTDLVSSLEGWFYVMNGRVTEEYTGLVRNTEGLWYVANGKLDDTYTNLVSSVEGWFYVMNGRVTEEYTGLIANENGNWYVDKGAVSLTHEGLICDATGWWYVIESHVAEEYTGFATNDAGTWYVQAGYLDFGFSGTVTVAGIEYIVVGGMAQ